MFNWFRKKEKRIAFIDGDQAISAYLSAYEKHIANTNTETHLIRIKKLEDAEPKRLRKIDEKINKIYLEGFTARKEVVDKFIVAYIQKSIASGYNHITVVSSDYDFIDIFKMATMLDEKSSNITFRLIIPYAQGRLLELPEKMLNIEIIK